MSKKTIARPNRRTNEQPSLEDIESFVQNGPGKDRDSQKLRNPGSRAPSTAPIREPVEADGQSSGAPENPATHPAASQDVLSPETPASRNSRKPVRSKFTIELDRDTHRRFKIAALQLDSTVQEEGVLALERHLRELEHRVERGQG